MYIASRSGHIYGYNLKTDSLDWDFYIGSSEIDGSAIVTNDNCLLISFKKQCIKGNGRVFKLTPRKKLSECVEWYFPVKGTKISSWDGGVIKFVGFNVKKNKNRILAAFIDLNGKLSIVMLITKQYLSLIILELIKHLN